MEKTTVKQFILSTMSGMTFGLFATLVIGSIVQQIGVLVGLELLHTVVYGRLVSLTGAGIGIGIALVLKMQGMKLVTAAVIGGISASFRFDLSLLEIIQTSPGDPFTIYLVVIFSILLMNLILRKKTPVDILLIPLLGIALSVILTFIISGPSWFLISQIRNFLDYFTTVTPFVMSIVIAVAMGIILTSPISSVAIAYLLSLGGIAAGAAVVGTVTQMVGFAVQSRKDNNIGIVLSIFFGTSMLQLKNVIKKPIIWLPTAIASAILAPIFVIIFNLQSTVAGAGMGTSGLVGPLQTIEAMGGFQSGNAWLMFVLVIAAPVVLVYFIDLVFRRFNLYGVGDLSISSDL